MPYTFQTVDNPSDPTFNQALGINDAGTIGGYYGSGANTRPNVGYTDALGTFVIENVPGAVQTQVTAINNLGQTVGFSVDGTGVNTGFVRNADGTFTTVANPATPTGGTGFNQLLGLNDRGIAAGFYNDAAGMPHGYTYDIATTTFTPVTIFGETVVQPTGVVPLTVTSTGTTVTAVTATGIDNAGDVSGFAVVSGVTEGFVQSSTGSTTMLTGPAGATATLAFGLNNEGQVVGQYTDASGVQHGFVYETATGSYTTIDDPNGAAGTTVVNGIDDQGQLVGFSTDTAGHVNGFAATATGLARITDPVAGATIDVAAGSDGVSVGGSNAVTLVDHAVGGTQLIANAGNDLIVTMALGDTVVGGSGNDTIFLQGQPSLGRGGQPVTLTGNLGDQAVLGGGDAMVVSTAQDTISATTGRDTVFASGAALTEAGGSSMLFIDQTGHATVVGGAGTLVAFGGGAAGGEVVGGSGKTTFVGGSGQATFVGGSGAAFVYAEAGGGLVQGGTGSLVFVGDAAGAAPVTIDTGPGAASIFAANGNSMDLSGSASDVITATTGNVTLVGGASSGNNVVVAGSGSDVLSGGSGNDGFFLGSGFATITGGGGADAYVALFGSGGTTRIEDFNTATDHFYLSGYAAGAASAALAGAVVSGNSTMVTLSDNSHITFVGVTQLTAASFG